MARLQKAGFALEGQALEQLALYLSLLARWNERMNLAGPETWEGLLDTLALDSFYLADFLRALPWAAPPLTWDFGAGAGIPGIPLRILWSEGIYWLVEAQAKRALFLRAALARLPLPGVRLYQGRAQEFMREAEPAGLLLSRAFMPRDKILALAAGRLAPGAFALVLANTPAAPLPAALDAHWRLYTEESYSPPGRSGPAFFQLFRDKRA